ncbi:MAG: hypothetical protein U5N53_21825 [Mycobacterium sp.]|nr:hypothetical protein [Mycobacterium sp.]
MKSAIAGCVAALAVATAPVAHADRDEAFADQLHDYGIYGQKDFNAWIAKLMCKRLNNGHWTRTPSPRRSSSTNS